MKTNSPEIAARHRQMASASATCGTKRVLAFAVPAEAADTFLGAEQVHKEMARHALRDYDCADCGTAMTAAAWMPAPLCACCGSNHVKASSAEYKSQVASADDQLESMECANADCRTSNVMHAYVVRASRGHAHCTSCGEPMAVTASYSPSSKNDPKPADYEPGMPEKLTDNEQVTPQGKKNPDVDTSQEPEQQPVMKMRSSAQASTGAAWPYASGSREQAAKQAAFGLDMDTDFDGDEDDANDATLYDDTNPPSLGGLSDEGLGGAELDLDFGAGEELAFGGDDGLLPGDPLDGGMQPSDQSGLGGSQGVASPSYMGDSPQVLGPRAIGDAERQTVPNDMCVASGFDDTDDFDMPDIASGEPMIDALGIDDSEAAFLTRQCGSRLVLMKGHYSVASLTAQTARPEHAGMLFTKGFRSALKASVQQYGLRKTIAEFNCTPLRTPVETASTAEKKVTAAVKEAETRHARIEQARTESMALAAAGMARNMWRDGKNPMMETLTCEFAALGVASPQAAAARVMARAGIEHSQALCERAATIARMKPSVRAQLAAAVNMIADPSERVEFDGNSEQAGVSPYEVTARLSAPASPVLQTPATQVAHLRTDPGALPQDRQRVMAMSANQMANEMMQGSRPLFGNL